MNCFRRAPFLPLIVAAAVLIVTASAGAQAIEDLPRTPELSLGASASQVVGVTNVSITYSSPAARGREIWGGLVPYGEVWRAGANAPTRVTFDQAVTVGGSEVAAGTYTLMIIPTESTWTAILNTDSSGRGAYGHNEAEDVARVEVTPTEGPTRERMLFVFNNTTNDGTELTLEWAGRAAAIPIATDTAAIVDANIQATLDSLWRPPYEAARYLLDAGGDMDRAAELMTSSIGINSNWWNNWFMARIEHERGNHASARTHAQQAQTLGAGDNTFESFFSGQIESALADWPAE
jgi:hypothetical protein